MQRYQYLIIGGGMSADSALKGIRMSAPGATVGLVSEELEKPYNRPPLSKALWDGLPIEHVWRPSRGGNLALHLGRRIVSLDPARKLARDQLGELYGFDQVLLALGSQPRRLAGDDTGVIYFRTLADYRRLRACAREGEPIAVIGAGLIGSEIAACLRKAGSAVDLYCGRRGLMRSILPQVLSHELARALETRGVRLHAAGVAQVRQSGGHQLVLDDGRTVAARRVVAGVGVAANAQLALDAGVACSDGIDVDASLQTSVRGIYAAGDCINYWCPALGRRVSSQHEEHANFSGVAAGRAMAGKPVQYDSLPYFYSRVFDHSYEGIGLTNAALEHRVVAPRGAMEATVYYLESNRVVGVLFWNVRADLERATALIESRRPLAAEDLARPA